MIDLSGTVQSKSDQLNADDLIGGPINIQVESIQVNLADQQQPVKIFYYGCNGKPFKPCLTVRKILNALWGSNGENYINKWMTLYVDPTVSFGKQRNIGGIRVSGLSHIQSNATLMLTVSRGKKQEFKISKINLEG